MSREFRQGAAAIFTAPGIGCSRGFSMFEMMVALIILAIMAAMSGPALGRMIDNLEFRQQVKQYSAILRYARLVAVSKGEVVSLRLSEDEDCLFILSGPVDETKECKLDEEDILTVDPGEIFFFPEGTATAALVTLERGERKKRIRLDLLTAIPVVE